jgi:hypothetical protein
VAGSYQRVAISTFSSDMPAEYLAQREVKIALMLRALNFRFRDSRVSNDSACSSVLGSRRNAGEGVVAGARLVEGAPPALLGSQNLALGHEPVNRSFTPRRTPASILTWPSG